MRLIEESNYYINNLSNLIYYYFLYYTINIFQSQERISLKYLIILTYLTIILR